MESLIKEALGVRRLESFGSGGGGCISSGSSFKTEKGNIYVKVNNKNGARDMFDGEFESLKSIRETQTVGCPEPKAVVDHPDGGAALITSYLDMKSLRKYSSELGTQLARMHLHNRSLKTDDSSVHRGHGEDTLHFVDKFGFHVPTCCGFIPQRNTWETDWPTFYARHKLKVQLDMIESEYHDSEARMLWSKLSERIPSFFKEVEVIPSLMHGDLWGGNAAETSEGPVVFDAASFYGHDEYDLGIAQMFGGFSGHFFTAYHRLIPEKPGHDTRLQLYQLFHYLNHWNHFGSGYRGQSISILKSLVQHKG